MDRVATETGAQRASEAYWEVMVDDIKLGSGPINFIEAFKPL